MKVIIETEDKKRVYKIPAELLIKELGISEKTLKVAVKRVLSKL